MQPTLFERIGGENAVRAAVFRMYDKILSDAELQPFFENVDVNALRNSQAAFVTYAFGGPNRYSGKNLRKVHEKAVAGGLNDRHFDLVAGHLKKAMEELGVPEPLINEALGIVGGTRKDVLNR